MSKTSRIVKNTTYLYIRMAVIMIVNLYTVRIVLKALGLEDYGIYNVVAGLITMLICVNNVITNATQRYYSFYLGKQDSSKLADVFNISLNIFLIFSGLVILIGETIGLWFVNNILDIPENRIFATNIVYQFSILTFLSSVLMIPYTAAIVAHEDMNLYTVLSSLEYVLKLIFAFLLFVIPFDRLITYSALLFLAHFLLFLSYGIICSRKYTECHRSKIKDKKLYKSILSFSGWNMFGSLAGIGMIQVNTILTNIFFGPIVNAARAISLQVNSAVTSFSNNIILAIRSPMIKSYAQKDYTYLNSIFIMSNKVIFIGMTMIILPMEFEMATLLKWWLGTNDPQAVLFSQLIVLNTLILAIANPITIIIQAVEKLKPYHLSVETITLMTPILTYIYFKLGYPAYSTYIIMIVIMSIAHVVRVICLKKFYKEFSVKNYIIHLCFPSLAVISLSAIALYYIYLSISSPLWNFIIVSISSVICVGFLSWFIELNSSERGMIKNFILNKYHSIHIKPSKGA